MIVIDAQIHLPTDDGKGEKYSWKQPDEHEWAERVEGSFQNRYGEDETYAVIPTVTNRDISEEDKKYIKALEDTEVEVATTAVEIDKGDVSANILGETSYDRIDDYLESGEETTAENFTDGIIQYGRENSEDTAILLSHPFSKDGGLLREVEKETEDDSGVYEDIVEAAEEIDIYTDQNSNFWTEEWKKAPWSWLNSFAGDRFGFGSDYWDIEEDTNGFIKNIGGTDVKDGRYAGFTASVNSEIDLENSEDENSFPEDIQETKRILSDPETEIAHNASWKNFFQRTYTMGTKIMDAFL